jgi:hypothetical protein
MNDKQSLRTIAEKLRQLARAAYGTPCRVQVTGDTLREYAVELERIAGAPAQGLVSPCDPTDTRPIWEQGLSAESKTEHLDASKN